MISVIPSCCYLTAKAAEVKGCESILGSLCKHTGREAMPELLLDSIPGKTGKFPLRQCDAQRVFSQNGKERTEYLQAVGLLEMLFLEAQAPPTSSMEQTRPFLSPLEP